MFTKKRIEWYRPNGWDISLYDNLTVEWYNAYDDVEVETFDTLVQAKTFIDELLEEAK